MTTTGEKAGEGRVQKRHALKTWPQFYHALLDGSKTFEIRKDDRDFQVGDILELNEYDPLGGDTTGRTTFRRVTYCLREPATFAVPGHVIMGIEQPKAPVAPVDEAANWRAERAAISAALDEGGASVSDFGVTLADRVRASVKAVRMYLDQRNAAIAALSGTASGVEMLAECVAAYVKARTNGTDMSERMRLFYQMSDALKRTRKPALSGSGEGEGK